VTSARRPWAGFAYHAMGRASVGSSMLEDGGDPHRVSSCGGRSIFKGRLDRSWPRGKFYESIE
jgi:hypothetical protein